MPGVGASRNFWNSRARCIGKGIWINCEAGAMSFEGPGRYLGLGGLLERASLPWLIPSTRLIESQRWFASAANAVSIIAPPDSIHRAQMDPQHRLTIDYGDDVLFSSGLTRGAFDEEARFFLALPRIGVAMSNLQP